MGGDLITFESQVKERIKGIVSDLIPEERWESIVAATISDFERNDLPKLVKSELEKMYSEIIRTELSKPEWRENWDINGKSIASEMVQKLAVEAAPLILANMIGSAVQQTIYSLNNNVQMGNYPRY